MFDLAWESEGRLTFNLSDVPDRFLDTVVEWANARIEAENDRNKS